MKLETFSFLPPMTADQVTRQIRHLLSEHLIPAVEYARQQDVHDRYWNMWKLPLFDTGSTQEVMAEIEACRSAHPDCYVKLIGYDRNRQTQAMCFVVHAPE